MSDSNAIMKEQSVGENSETVSTRPSPAPTVERLNNVEDSELSSVSFMNTFQTVDKRDVADSAVTSDHIREHTDEALSNDSKGTMEIDKQQSPAGGTSTESSDEPVNSGKTSVKPADPTLQRAPDATPTSVSETSTDASNSQSLLPPMVVHPGPPPKAPVPPQQFQAPPQMGVPPNMPPPRPPIPHHLQHLPPVSQPPPNFNVIHSGSSIVAPPQLNFNRPPLSTGAGPNMPAVPPPNTALPPPNRPQIPPPDIWVETTAPNGKVYYYHAQSRQTQWNRPMNATVMTQEEFKKMVLTISSNLPLPLPNMGATNIAATGANAMPVNNMNSQQLPPPQSSPAISSQPVSHQVSAPPPGNFNPPPAQPPMIPPPNMMGFHNPNMPPRPAVPPFGMFPPARGPPPNVPPMQQPPNFQPGIPPPGAVPSQGAPPASAPPFAGPQAPKPTLPGTEWAENTAPDGKKYWYNVRTMQTTWTKPKPVEDAEKLQKEAEELTRIEEEKKKKEEADRIEREAKEAEAKARAKPIASQPIPHSPWCVVFTGDHKVFYYNPSSKLSVWHRPEELVNNKVVDNILTNPPHKTLPAALAPTTASADATATGANGAKPATAASTEEEDESPAAKKKKTEAVAQQVDEARVANLRSNIPFEVRQQQFMEMLGERNVSAYSTWDKELPKIVFDHRYSLLNAKERKNVFDVYTRNKAEEERKERNNKLKERKEEFRAMLEQSGITSRMTFTEWTAKGWNKDARFKAIEKNRERESMFDEYVAQLRVKEQQSTKAKLSNMKDQFFSLLSEQSYLDESARWSKLRMLIEDDSRYKVVPSATLREQWFNEYIDEVKKKMDPSEVREAEKRKRIEESMRARQQAVAEERELNNRVITEQRLQHRREESVQRFKALLVDIIKDAEMTWKAGRRLMKKDHRWSGGGLEDEDSNGGLTRDDKETLFNEHIEQLGEKRKQQYRELLDQSEGISFTTNWRDARRKIKDDPRYEKFSSSDRRREREFDNWKETAYMRAKHNFKELLKETRLITNKSFSMVKQSEHHMHDIEEVLKKDKRYLVLNSINQERRKMIMAFLEDMSKRGPPPPPTASDPSRRLLASGSANNLPTSMEYDFGT